MFNKLIGCLILLALLVLACTLTQPISSPSVVASNATFGKTPSDTPEPSKTIMSQVAIPSTTQTPHPTPNSSPTPEVLIQQCFEQNSSLPKEIIPQGLLVIKTLGKGISLRNFKAGTQREIPESGLAAGTSPDGKWLIYDHTTSQSRLLTFESMEGKQPILVPVDLNWLLSGSIRWLDDQRIWFPEISVIEPVTSVMVFNPFTSEKDLLRTDYPKIHGYMLGSSPRLHFGYSSAVYDPSLNFVIYPELESNGRWFQTLWNRNAKATVARVRDDGSYGNLPLWQDSQQRFLLVGFPDSSAINKEWISLGLEGQIRAITDFGTLGRKYRIENNASLSPDGKTLAFGLNYEQGGEYLSSTARLVLLDLETGKATDTCLPVGNRIKWSLDGQYLAISTPEGNQIFLVDPKLEQSYQLSESAHGYLVGWLIQP